MKDYHKLELELEQNVRTLASAETKEDHVQL